MFVTTLPSSIQMRVWTAEWELTLAFVTPSFSSFSPGLLTPPPIHNHLLDPLYLLLTHNFGKTNKEPLLTNKNPVSSYYSCRIFAEDDLYCSFIWIYG